MTGKDHYWFMRRFPQLRRCLPFKLLSGRFDRHADNSFSQNLRRIQNRGWGLDAIGPSKALVKSDRTARSLLCQGCCRLPMTENRKSEGGPRASHELVEALDISSEFDNIIHTNLALSIRKRLFRPISDLCSTWHPRNINPFHALRFFASLDLDQNAPFRNGHQPNV